MDACTNQETLNPVVQGFQGASPFPGVVINSILAPSGAPAWVGVGLEIPSF